MSDAAPATSALAGRVRHWLLPHAIAYCVVIGSLSVANFATGAPWWAFWPTLVWGVILALHFFVARSLDVDEAWVEERADDLRTKSYDFGHIADIEERVARHDPSVRPGDERDEQRRRSKEAP